MVSIIITTYCGEKTIKKAIESILKQSYQNFEILVVDDNFLSSNASNKTKEVLVKLNDNRIRYFQTGHYNGARARNIGIKEAKGEYISFLDDDDIYLENRLEMCVETLQQHGEYDGVYTGVIIMQQSGRITECIIPKRSGSLQKELLCNRNLIGSGSNIFLRKKAIEDTGLFDENFMRFQDVEYMLRVMERHKIIAIQNLLVLKINNGGKNMPNPRKILQIYEQFLQKFEYIISKMNDKEKKLFYKSMVDCFAIDCKSKLKNDKETNEIIHKFENKCKNNISLKCKLKIIVKNRMPRTREKIYDYMNLKNRLLLTPEEGKSLNLLIKE